MNPVSSRILVAVLAVSIGGFVAAPAQGAIIRLKDRVTPQGPLIRLADVAEISDADPAAVARLGAITLQPATGKPLRVDFDLVRSRLIAHGVNLSEIEFAGQSSVATVTETRPATPIPARTAPAEPKGPTPQERAQEILREAFARRFQGLTQTDDVGFELTVRVRDEDLPRVLETPAGAIRFQERSLVEGGPQPLTLLIAPTSETPPQLIRVAAWLERQPRILTVRHQLPRDHVLQPQDLQWIRQTDENRGISVLAEAVGRATRKALRPGDVVQPSDLTVVALVRGGDIVSVRVSAPGVVVRRQFKAMSGGGLDEVVSLVAIDDPRERIQARVTGFHEAELISAGPGSVTARQTAANMHFVPAAESAAAGGLR